MVPTNLSCLKVGDILLACSKIVAAIHVWWDCPHSSTASFSMRHIGAISFLKGQWGFRRRVKYLVKTVYVGIKKSHNNCYDNNKNYNIKKNCGKNNTNNNNNNYERKQRIDAKVSRQRSVKYGRTHASHTRLAQHSEKVITPHQARHGTPNDWDDSSAKHQSNIMKIIHPIIES
ncbi:hypothetical protein HELRODRAFT_178700 [Helobdella robusta]|uniref:Uncharacterized protein n=1 Tax=Helobdella robusta TaxID=6412 RepID=T1FDL3_HELRO|nr:hypothetical protein HELRODRAFT_178700 [Helobdella robusta]ESN96901.1 hypothetical protein HELRODRAFT_178700 [Helobdella robusta]